MDLKFAERFAQGQRLRHFVHPHAAGGLVHQIDGLVRQEAIGDVAGRKPRGRAQRLIADGNLMMCLVGLADALEDVNRLFDGRLFHQHGLEAALQRGVPLDVLAILIQRGGADTLQLTARQGRLQQIRGIHAAARAARAHQHVDFVNEKNGVAIGDLLDHLLEALLELAAVHRARHQCTYIQH